MDIASPPSSFVLRRQCLLEEFIYPAVLPLSVRRLLISVLRSHSRSLAPRLKRPSHCCWQGFGDDDDAGRSAGGRGDGGRREGGTNKVERQTGKDKHSGERVLRSAPPRPRPCPCQQPHLIIFPLLDLLHSIFDCQSDNTLGNI